MIGDGQGRRGTDGERLRPLGELRRGELVLASVTRHERWGLIARLHGFDPVGASLDLIRRSPEPGVRRVNECQPPVGSTLELVVGEVRARTQPPWVWVDLTADAPAGEPLILGEAATREWASVMGSYFQRVQWVHDSREDPVVLWAHIVDRWEVRKVDEFADGRLVWADDTRETEATRLGAMRVPRPEVIGADPQFVVEIIGRSDFERVWLLARGEHSASPRQP